MSEHSNSQHIYKPSKQSIVYYLVDLASLLAGILFIILSSVTSPRGKVIYILAGVVMCLSGIWQFFTTRAVRGTYFVTTYDEVILVSSLGAMSLKWNEIIDALIRRRPSIIQFGRFDRLVALTDRTNRKLPLNTSILSRWDEETLLEEIRQKVQCPIREMTDGLISFSRWGN